MRKVTISLPEEAARELGIYAATRFQTQSRVILEALTQAGVVKRPEREGGSKGKK